MIHGRFPDLRVAMEELKVGGDSPEYHWALTGTNTGPGGTGRAVRISGFERWTIGDDGLIAASLGSYDEADGIARSTVVRSPDRRASGVTSDRWRRQVGSYVQPSCTRLIPSFQIFVR